MLKRYQFWLWVAIAFQILNAVAHSLSFFITPVPNNETERQLIDLMANYRMDMGAGIYRSMGQLFTALSACFPLLCLLGALNNIYVLRKRLDAQLIKGLVSIQLVVFGICFGVVAVFAFLLPIILTGLIFITLAITYFMIPASEH
ncbi:MAG: hypothetical protein C5B44_06325 [Acidobacteria bacterium]|nr:MAG: hypothetical protein C5B44_06325 [Acidobacteriota bacterium]